MLFTGASDMGHVILDVEATGALRNHAHPFDHRNKLVLIGLSYLQPDHTYTHKQWYLEDGYLDHRDKNEIESVMRGLGTLIGHNLKFDLHWLNRYNIAMPRSLSLSLYDTQVAEFLVTNQKSKMPSLAELAAKYLPANMTKTDLVKQYWESGVDTDKIPKKILMDYNKNDLELTGDCYLALNEIMPDSKRMLMLCYMRDLDILREMERNGAAYDVKQSIQMAEDAEAELEGIESQLVTYITTPPGCRINFGSDEQLSAILYGGKIKYTVQIQDGHYKTGFKAGQPKYRKDTVFFPVAGLFKPPKSSRLKTEGQYSTDEDTLSQLPKKGKRGKIVELVLRRKRLAKLIGTYYRGLPNKFEENGWEGGCIHPQLNQTVAITGRLSSSNPNLQNPDASIKKCFVTRYKNVD